MTVWKKYVAKNPPLKDESATIKIKVSALKAMIEQAETTGFVRGKNFMVSVEKMQTDPIGGLNDIFNSAL